MITAYFLEEGGLRAQPLHDLQALGAIQPLWLDLCNPSEEEERAVERALGVDIPARDELAEIEDTSRNRQVDDVLFMSSTVISGIGEGRPTSAVASFVLAREWLVTVRYARLSSFDGFAERNARSLRHCSADQLLTLLLDGLIDRIADTVEELQGQLDSLSRRIFDESSKSAQPADLQRVLKHLGRCNGLLARLSESALSLGRLIGYARQNAAWLGDAARVGLKSAERDLRSLGDYQTRMSSEISFLLDATLGLINIEQNSIIKVFSIAAVLFLPPTLVGTVYGMNFRHMPELDWPWGYPLAIAAMFGSAALSYAWFKFRNWL